MVERCECLIVGGGPAGSALAFLLAQRGLRVVLADHGRAHHSGPLETLLAPAHRLLRRSGLLELVLPHAAVDPLRHGAIWGRDAIEWRPDAEPGLLLHRGAFDTALRSALIAAGVDVRCPARAERLADGGVRLTMPDRREVLRPRHVVVATGRARPPWPCQRELLQAGPQTTALTWVGEPDPADRGTAVVEAVPTGWIWTHAPAAGPASAAVLLDADATCEHGAKTALQAALAAARGPAARMQQARLAHATNATARLHRTMGEELLLGDAASCIDPLASQGVEKALAAADHAAAVIATAVARPAWWPRLRSAHAHWEAGLFFGHAAATTQWYAREERFTETVFWQRRRTVAVPRGEAVGWDTLLVRSPALVLQQVLVRQGDVFVEADGVCDPATGEELAQVGYVSVRPLLDLFRAPGSLRTALAAAGGDARLHVLSPHAIHTGLRALLARGWLIAAASAPGSR